MNTEKFIKVAMSFALELANKSSNDEETINTLANQYVQDALLDIPTSPEGVDIRAKTLPVLDGSVISPFQNKTGFDYTKLRGDTTIVALKEVFAIIGKYADLIPDIDESDDVQDKISKAYNDCTLEIFKLFNEKNVRMEDYGYAFGVLKGVVGALDDVMKQQVQGHRTEIFSRLLNVKNPGTNKFDSNFAKYDDLVKLLENVRKETGNDMEDYFTIDKS